MPTSPTRPSAVFFAFLKLGLLSFGGPVAHIGYFHQEFVQRRRWLGDAEFSDLVALCQFLPGPASSQVGFGIGLARAGCWGGLAAWCGFTLPSAAVMILLAHGIRSTQGPATAGVIHGLTWVAVAIVAQAVVSMARLSCGDGTRMAIAAVAGAIGLSCAATGAAAGAVAPLQIAILLAAGALGGWLCRMKIVPGGDVQVRVSRGVASGALTAFALLLVTLPLCRRWPMIALFEAFYRSGALVFGGGHVVLPLLRDAFVTSGWVSNDAFLAGYGAAQAVPGPLFTFAAYLGALAMPAGQRLAGALVGLTGIFLPGLLILVGALPFWQRMVLHPVAGAAMRGINAAVVGLLAAALVTPIGTVAIHTATDAGVVLCGFMLLMYRVPPAIVVIAGALCGALLA